jgi:hypothetical protein
MNTTEAKPTRHALPIVVKDTANPFIEPTSVPSSTEPISIPSSSKPSSKVAQTSNVTIQLKPPLQSSRQPSRKIHLEPQQQSDPSAKKVVVKGDAAPTTRWKGDTGHSAIPDKAEKQCTGEETIRSLPTLHTVSPDLASITPTARYIQEEQSKDVDHLATPTQTAAGVTTTPAPEMALPAVEIQIQHDQETMSLPEFKDMVSAQDGKSTKVTLEDTTEVQQETQPTDDYSVPLKDDDVTPEPPSSPRTTMGTSVKSVFSPSAVTFAALPTRDLPRGRSLGASKHQRMTSHLLESTVPEVEATVKTPGPAPSLAFPRPSENKAAVSKAARDSKSGGTGAGSSWISRKVLAGSGGEDLRKSLAASKRPSTIAHAMDDESDKEADELDDHPKQLVARASEAPAPAQRFSIASKTPQAPHQSRQTLGASTISRPVEQSQTNLSKMIADLQERRAVATFNASVTRATLPSLQLGRGAQGIAAMGISSGLLGRAALQASLDRSRTADSQMPQVDAFDVFDEKPDDTPKSSAPKSMPVNATGGQGEPSTTEELNQAVDEILRKISTERQMQQVPEVTSVAVENAKANTYLPSTLQAVEISNNESTKSITPTVPRISRTRAEEQEVEELTKRTNAMSVTSRESAGLVTPAGNKALSPKKTRTVAEPLPTETAEYVPEEPPVSTTPVNSPPKVLYRTSHGQTMPPQSSEAPPKPVRHESAAPMKQKPEVIVNAAKPIPATKHLPSKTRDQQQPVNNVVAAPRGLSQSQAVSIDSDESDDSMDESVFEDALGDKRFDEDEVLADEVAKLAKPLRLNSAEQSSRHEVVDSDSDTDSVEEVESNGTASRAPVSSIADPEDGITDDFLV